MYREVQQLNYLLLVVALFFNAVKGVNFDIRVP